MPTRRKIQIPDPDPAQAHFLVDKDTPSAAQAKDSGCDLEIAPARGILWGLLLGSLLWVALLLVLAALFL